MEPERVHVFAGGAHARGPTPSSGQAHTTRRIRFVALAFMGGFSLIAGRLFDLALFPPEDTGQVARASQQVNTHRPDIFDRNGAMVATDIQVASLFADPRRVVDIGDTVDQLMLVMPELDRAQIRERLGAKRAFVWLKRGLTPRQKAEIHNLGMPGLGFIDETRRVYPAGPVLAHVVGHVNVDNAGQSGIEKHLDLRAGGRSTGLSAPAKPGPVTLSVDLRVNHAMRDELAQAMETFSAKAAAGVIMDVETGEVVALSSLPDFDPHKPADALKPDRINRITKGLYELGSTFKTFTTAMALDTGVATLETSYDARTPIRVGRHTINDFHAKSRFLTLPEIFIYSSNIGSAKMALDVGTDGHQAFLRRLGMLDRLRSEIPETGVPLVPDPWREVSSMTIAFGHGLSVTPLHAAAAAAALVNGGKLVPPTFVRRTPAEAALFAEQVLHEDTSRKMRYLMRLNVNKGTARKAAVEGFRVGGKTGTAEKAGARGYDRNRLLTTFIGCFPADSPRYVVVILLDEPKGTKETFGHATSGWNAAPTVAAIIRRVAPMLGVAPDSISDSAPAEVLLAATN